MENSFLKVKKSPIHGKGIFTDREIHKDETFYKIPLEKIFSHAVEKCAKINNKWICDENVLNFVNHSCEPNTKLDISQEEPCLISIRDIPKNEEITVNYDSTEINGNKVFCKCKKPNCKGFFLKAS